MIRFLCLIAAGDRLWNIRKAFRSLEEQYPGCFQGDSYAVRDINDDPALKEKMMSHLEDYQFGVVYFHSGFQHIPDFSDMWQQLTAHMPVYFESSLADEMAERIPTSGVTGEQYQRISEYFRWADEPNYVSMFLHIAHEFAGFDCQVPPPLPPRNEGFFTLEGILDEQQSNALRKKAAESDRPVIGLILQQTQIRNGNTRHIQAVLRQLEALDVLALPLFTRMANDENDRAGIRHAMDHYFTWEGRRLPDCIMVMVGFSLTHMGWPGDGSGQIHDSLFTDWDVPTLQVMNTRFTPEEYESKPQGMDSMSLNMHIFQPELDGQIITSPSCAQIAATEEGVEHKILVPLKDRIYRDCTLAKNWAMLRRMPQSEKKVAILFHTQHGNAKIGCAESLDSFASVHRIVQRLKADGIVTDYDCKDPQELADRICAGLTNDLRWVSEEDMEQLAAAAIPREIWEKWFGKLSPKMQKELHDSWGAQPGEVMLSEDGKFLIPGMLCGNIFIGLQPARSLDEKAAELYHSTDAVPPYSYLAYYRWLDECFGANAVYHIGTHGTVEWLPGKEVGLSKDCYGDACLESLPNLYPYHIGITGEGIQAKRRSRAVILDHMPASLDEAESYEGLSVIDEALKELHQARQTRPAQVPQLQRRIFDLAKEQNLTDDLRLTEEVFQQNPDGAIEKIHLWMSDIKNSLVKDGLHILGEVPQGKLFDNLLRALLRVRNGSVPALNDSVLTAMGYDADAVITQPARDFGGASGMMLLDQATDTARRMVGKLSRSGYDSTQVPAVIEEENFPGSTADLRRVLEFACDVVADKLNHITDEMDNLIGGTDGRFVPPSLGGNPTRGNVDILPTGRNFYATDPAQIPSRAAWDIGGKLADQMLEEYRKERQELPETVAMVIWAGNTLKTCGEDFAECLHLMGVRPRYLGSTTRVIGVEPIPLAQLGRPRLDVTLRISGLFRDMYPNLIALMDQAVNAVAELDEPEDQNFIKKHIREDMEKFTAQGLPEDRAADHSYTRVYGCAPGCYGAGISHVIDSKEWQDPNDLAKVFETWGSYAYTAKDHGVARTEGFRSRMASVKVTIKNESTAEYDMLDSDDFYAYHGGLVACVKAISGQAPLSFTAHTDNPDRPVTRDLARETARIVRSKILNPKWLEGLKRHGFKGAQEIASALDSLFGWDATAQVADDWMYQKVAETFLLDEETRQWMEQVNKWSVHSVSERLLEANKRGMWDTDEETLRQLQSIYMEAEGTIEDGSDI